MSLYADSVFHVLAHVRGNAAASLFDPQYVAFAERHLGAAKDRALGEDANVLARVLADHDTLATAQCLAWLFDRRERAAACVDRDLAELAPDDVDRAALLVPLQSAGAGVELLRAAVDLEAPHHAQLPPVRFDPDVTRAFVLAGADVAPMLARCELHFVRALRLRGRVVGRAIWIGADDEEIGPSRDHLLMQAAHEATVREVDEALRGADVEPLFQRLEEAAVALLADRVRRAGGHRQRQHEAWLAHFGGRVVPRAIAALAPEVQSAIARR